MARCPVITTNTEKGGASKTTTVSNLGLALARRGRSVLLVDLEYQANLTGIVALAPVESEATIGALLIRAAHGLPASWDSVVLKHCHHPNLDLLPADPFSMNAANLVISGGGDEAELLLKGILEPARELYDYIIVDTCPRLFDPTVSLALLAATHVLIPVLPEAFAVGGVQPLLGRIESFTDRNPGLSVLGLLPSRVPANRIAARDALSALQYLPVRVFNTVIHEATEVNDAHNTGRPALATYRRTRTVEEYEQLAEEVEMMLAVKA